jgi:curved DNA-binding protein CbpA
MSETTDYYQILGVPEDASIDQITAAYRALALRYHPDRNKSFDAEEKMKQINEAYNTLSDEQKRVSYRRNPTDWSVSDDEFLFKSFLNMDDDALAKNLKGKSKADVRKRRAHWGLIRPRILPRPSNDAKVQRIGFELKKGQKLLCGIKVSGGSGDVEFSVFHYEERLRGYTPKNSEVIRNSKAIGYELRRAGDYCFYFSNAFSWVTKKTVEFAYQLENTTAVTLVFTL